MIRSPFPFRFAAATLGFATLMLSLVGAAQRPLRSVGLTVGDLGNPFFVQVAKGAEAKARELGGAGTTFSAVSANYDLNLQTNQMEDFIAAKVDLILLGAADTKGIAPAVRKARAAGIIVVAVDVAAEGGVSATVMSDNLQAGRIAAEFVAQKLGGKGRVVIINGPPVSSVMDRVRGAEEVFRKHSGIRILSRDQNAGGNRMGGMTVATDLLTANPELDAIFAINDPTGLGAALAVRQARRDKVFVVGVDGAPDAEKALKDSKSAFLATAAQDPYAMAGKAVEVGFGLLQGRPPTTDPLLVPVSLVTRENISTYKGWTSK
jgi:ribose transport system substrate-binding protein